MIGSNFPRGHAWIVFIAGLVWSASGWAEDVDFSCVIEKVLPKTMVTPRYQEFDVVLENDCPGPVNWTMCLETTDPFTHRVTETLTPSGLLAKDEKSRVNLQMKQQEDRQNQLKGYEGFYVNILFGIDSVPKPSCVAQRCEREKKSLRDQIRSNQRAWQKAESDLNSKKKRECPQGGWSERQQEQCYANLERLSKDQMDEFRARELELKTELSEVSPATCTLYTVE